MVGPFSPYKWLISVCTHLLKHYNNSTFMYSFNCIDLINLALFWDLEVSSPWYTEKHIFAWKHWETIVLLQNNTKLKMWNICKTVVLHLLTSAEWLFTHINYSHMNSLHIYMPTFHCGPSYMEFRSTPYKSSILLQIPIYNAYKMWFWCRILRYIRSSL